MKATKALFGFFIVIIAAQTVISQIRETGFLNRSVKVGGSEYRYVVYVPRKFARTKSWPVIVALHGGGEYGSDGLRQTNGYISRAIRLNPDRFPAVVVIPQAKADGTPGWQLEGGKAALAALDRSIKEFSGDPKRVILTGGSAGGNGTWSIASRFPERFAAVVPICGFVSKFSGRTSGVNYPSIAPEGDVFEFVAKRVSALPIWIFHGDADDRVSVEESRKMYAALKTVGANVQYTELPGVDHNAWDPAYARADLIEWMLKQRRR